MLFKAKVLLASLLTIQLGTTLAQNNPVAIYSQTAIIPWNLKAPTSVDQSQIYNDIYYLADRTNVGVQVASLVSDTQTTLIKGFIVRLVNGTVSPRSSGPAGLIVLPDRNELWVGDGDGTVKVISTINNTIVAIISTGSKYRADEFGYDPAKSIVVVTNPNEAVPFVTVMSATTRTVLGKIMFPGATELEQPAFNAVTGVFYISVVSSTMNPGGAICSLDLATMSISATYPLSDCDTSGIVFGPNQYLFIACNSIVGSAYVMDTAANGKIIANITGLKGIDQVAYNPLANLYYATASYYYLNNTIPTPFLGIINASSNTLVQKITTDNVTAHSVAVSHNTGMMVVPISKKGAVVYKLNSVSSSSGGSSPSGTTSAPPVMFTGAAVSWYPMVSIAIVGAAASAVFNWL